MPEPMRELTDFLRRHRSLFILTGAGISTASGIPDYRDERGEWKHRRPMEYREFVDRETARQRYWARSWVGWKHFRRAEPNAAHRALADLERRGRVERIVTQNVDGLQQRAGSRTVTELHGSLARVACIDCGNSLAREVMQRRLLELNPALAGLDAISLPDGDAEVDAFDSAMLRLPACEACGGVLKPEVVFFGETVPPARVDQSFAALERADAMLVVGSSLMIYSGFRFARRAAEIGMPLVAINLGKTRADDLLTCKVEQDCATALTTALAET